MHSTLSRDTPAYQESSDGVLPPYQDDAPDYLPSLHFSGLALHKIEFDTPWTDRGSALKPVVVELNSNQLNIYEFCADKATMNAVKYLFKHQNYDDKLEKEPVSAESPEDYFFDGDAYGDDTQPDGNKPMFSKLRHRLDKQKTKNHLRSKIPGSVSNNNLLFEPTADQAVFELFARTYRGKLLHSYTLLNLNAGEAPSVMSAHYKEDKHSQANAFALVKYRNTLRLRVEFTQMLLSFWSFHGMVHWFRNMMVGRDLASSIDERKLSTLKSIPRNFSVANNALLLAASREALHRDPTTMKTRHRNSISSAEDCESCFSGHSLQSNGTRASSVASSCSEGCSKLVLDVYGSKILCLENFYTPVEKQYISNCIPVLNSFDKWTGHRVTISDYEKFIPKSDKSSLNQGGKLFISSYNFTNSVKSYNKHAASPACGVRRCKDFYVDGAGLVGLEEIA